MVLWLFAACAGVRADRAEGLVLNELLAMNVASNADPAGEFDDWIEIYNGGAEPVSLEGVYLSDDPDAPARWALPADEPLEPGAYLLVWCDDEPEQGVRHSTFKLAGGGESVTLSFVDDDAPLLLDQVDFGEQLPDVAWARTPDGGVEWSAATPTPGQPNE